VKWRCEWCEKPHEENDPPCDNCGHGSFEQAVVQVAPETEGGGEDHAWVCADCGTVHPKNSPPCGACGAMQYERVPVEEAYDLSDLETPSYLELARPYLPYVLGVLVVVGLFATGIVPVPSPIADALDPGPPSIEDVPGEASASGDLNFSAVETEVVVRINEERRARGNDRIGVDRGLDDYAAYSSQYNAVVVFTDRDPEFEQWDPDCGPTRGRFVALDDWGVGETPTEDAVATAVLDSIERNDEETWTGLRDEASAVGVDVHRAPDGRFFVTVLYC